MHHELYMQRCLHLAQLGEGSVAPNPMVGAVLVYDNTIIGEGYHRRFGEAHAEVACLNAVQPHHRHLIEKATLYVSLEPCSHFGKTPPCADLILRHNIPQVIIGCADPFAEVSGRGIKKLEAAGVAVTIGVLKEPCRRLNKRFVLFQEAQRPYINLKWAQSADGKISGPNGSRVAISNTYTNRLVHRLRSQNMAILVGTNTALADDPQLSTRMWPGKNPVRLVVDKTGRLPRSLALFNGQQPTLVFTNAPQAESPNLRFQQVENWQNLVPEMLQTCYRQNIQSILVEGGAQLLQSFIDAGFWDEALVITNQALALGEGVAAPILSQHKLLAVETVFNDTLHTYASQTNTLL